MQQFLACLAGLAMVLSSSVLGFGQKVSVVQDSLGFGQVTTGTEDTVEIILQNNTSQPIEIADADVISAQFSPFYLLDSVLTISPSGQATLRVVFRPRHNILHDGEVLIHTITNEGHLAVDITGTGVYADAFYAATQDKSEEQLKQTLKLLISNHNSLGYNFARDKMFMEVDNKKVNGQGASANTVEGVYTGEVAVGYTSRSHVQNSFNFNTEHTFPQGTFNSNEPMKSDLYHLFPTKVYSNSERGNKPFGYVSNPSWSVGGSKSNASTFEPRDEQKGPTARAMLYFLVRYQNYQNYVTNTHQQVLREWALNYLPDAVEEKRNDDIAALQNNRNPFIDHPEFVERIHNFIGPSSAPVVRDLVITADTINFYTASPGTTLNYHLLLANGGNTAVNVSNFLVNHPDVLVVAPPASVPPGEAVTVHLSYTVGGTAPIGSTLSFSTDDPAQPAVTIPVIAHTGHYAGTGQLDKEVVKFISDPASGLVKVAFGKQQKGIAAIFSIDGRMVDQQAFTGDEYIVDAPKLAGGIYLLQIKFNSKTYNFKFVKH